MSSNQVFKVNSCLYAGTNYFLHGREVAVENHEATRVKLELK